MPSVQYSSTAVLRDVVLKRGGVGGGAISALANSRLSALQNKTKDLIDCARLLLFFNGGFWFTISECGEVFLLASGHSLHSSHKGNHVFKVTHTHSGEQENAPSGHHKSEAIGCYEQQHVKPFVL